MERLVKLGRTMEQAPVAEPIGSLAQVAVELLHAGSNVAPENLDLVVEERAVWQPDSWLMQCCWQTLADHGAGEEALAVAALLELRNPLAPAQALYRVAQQAPQRPDLKLLVIQNLHRLRTKLFNTRLISDDTRQTERLLLAAASAALIEEDSLAVACLERLDQLPRAWDRVMVSPELRGLLARTVSRVGLHPLTAMLVSTAIRRYEDTGAQLLHQIQMVIGPRLALSELPKRSARLMQRCVESFLFATLTTLNSRRLAAIAFGQAGKVEELLAQLTTMANVQEARRASGLADPRGDPNFIRQVKRPNANPDVDYQVYTLQEAIRAMPVRRMPREARIVLADRVAELAVRSDGWTAAGAAATLVDLGALRYAVDVVDHISPNDPTRSEGVISLVRGLLTFGDPVMAREQVDKALAWVKTVERRNPERATVWGLAEAYLEHGQPDDALSLLDQRYVEPGFMERVLRVFQNSVSDDELRDNRLRFQALLQRDHLWSRELQTLFDQLRQWAPRLLDGEAIIAFYVDGLLRPLLSAGHGDRTLNLLPQIAETLSTSSGDKHAVHVQRVTSLLAEQITTTGLPDPVATLQGATNGNGASALALPTSQQRAQLCQFLVALWQADAVRGIWQMVHGVEGSLPLLYALEGADAVVTIAQSAANDGGLWSQ